MIRKSHYPQGKPATRRRRAKRKHPSPKAATVAGMSAAGSLSDATVVAARKQGTTPVAPLKGVVPRDTAPDYSYVFRDLRRFAIIAGGMVVFLIILAVFLR